MSTQPMSDEMREDIRRMTEALTNQSTIEILTRAGNQAKYNRWVLQERKKAREEAMARAESNKDADNNEEDVTRDTGANVAATTTDINEENMTSAGANETNAPGMPEANGKVRAKVRHVVSRVAKSMNCLSMTENGTSDKTADDKPDHGSQRGGGDKA